MSIQDRWSSDKLPKITPPKKSSTTKVKKPKKARGK